MIICYNSMGESSSCFDATVDAEADDVDVGCDADVAAVDEDGVNGRSFTAAVDDAEESNAASVWN